MASCSAAQLQLQRSAAQLHCQALQAAARVAAETHGAMWAWAL
eukprot:SAG11_NODE_26008_length_351_cov_0.599206_1_plen_42_part_01